MKYMKMLLLTTMCFMLTIAMTGCGDDTMNSATYGDEEMDNMEDEVYDDGDSFMESLEDGVDDIIDDTTGAVDDIGHDLEDGVDDITGDGIYDDGDMETLDSDAEKQN